MQQGHPAPHYSIDDLRALARHLTDGSLLQTTTLLLIAEIESNARRPLPVRAGRGRAD